MDVKTKALRQVLVTRRENEALVLYTRKTDFPTRVADQVFVFPEMGVGQNFPPKLGTQCGKVRSLPGAEKMNMCRQAVAPALVFFKNVCGRKSVRLNSEHETGK